MKIDNNFAAFSRQRSFILVLGLACDGEPSAPPDVSSAGADGASTDAAPDASDGDATDRGPAGKADTAGSCEGAEGLLCGGPSEGACSCDDACGSFGDCCVDKAQLCDAEPTDDDPPPPPDCESDQWQMTSLETISQLGEPSLAVDGQDRPHVLYSLGALDTLRYAWLEAQEWTSEDVPLGGRAPALAVGADGRVHACFTRTNFDIVYAARAPDGQWSTEVLSSFGSSCQIELDDAGVVHMAYNDGSDVSYARREADSAWQIETAIGLSSVDFARTPSLAVGPGGQAHVAFRDALAPGSDARITRYAQRSGDGRWTAESISVGDAASVFSGTLRARQDGTVVYAYTQVGAPIVIAVRDASWVWSDVGIGVDSSDASMALNTQYHAELVYLWNTAVEHAWWDASSSTWQTDTIDDNGRMNSTAFAIDDHDGRHCAYFDFDHDELRYAYRCSAG